MWHLGNISKLVINGAHAQPGSILQAKPVIRYASTTPAIGVKILDQHKAPSWIASRVSISPGTRSYGAVQRSTRS